MRHLPLAFQTLLLMLATASLGSAGSAAGAERQPHTVEISGFAFQPGQVEVTVGDSVQWANLDLAPHTATADDEAWTTDVMSNGSQGKFTARSAGRFPYHCRFHPEMKGLIVVKGERDLR